MDLKVMPKSYKGHTLILCIMYEVTNFLITVLICQSRSEEIGDALIENVISKYCILDCNDHHALYDDNALTMF